MEKRESERYQLAIPAKLIFESKENQEQILNLKTRDISSKGAFLNTEKKLQQGIHVQLELYLTVEKLLEILGEEQKIKVKVKGEVIRINSQGLAVMFDKDYEIKAIRPQNHNNHGS